MALAAEEVEEDLEVEEEALALQMTMMMMVVPKDLVTEEAEEDLVPVAMMERRAQAHVVVLAPDEEDLADLNRPMMEKTQKGLAAEEAVVLVDLEQLMMKMMVNPEDVGEAEVAVDVVAPATVTLMMAILTLQNLV